jgi:predicted nucleic acid-binding protein
MSRGIAFWDTSALIPLCVSQPQTSAAASLYGKYRIITWWATEVEIMSGLTRLRRMRVISSDGFSAAKKHARMLVKDWFSIHESINGTATACSLLEIHALRAADALQLAASLEACRSQPDGRVFITGDQRQAEAARHIGFSVEFV